jgi:ATP-dependent exoDNAse (exonuclease V) beta subunit
MTAARHAALADEQQHAQKVAALPIAKRSPRATSQDFIRKISPSGLIEKLPVLSWRTFRISSEFRPTQASSTMKRRDTAAGGTASSRPSTGRRGVGLGTQVRGCVARLPEHDRATAEWRLLTAHLGSDADFRRRLGTRDFIAHAEVPFSLKLESGTTALEGVIDLVLIDPVAGRALVLDWKTNRVDTNNAGSLRAKYRSQLAAYWHAVRQITGFQVEASLYSTATGQLLMFTESELVAEWSRLAQLPSAQLGAEVGPDEI